MSADLSDDIPPLPGIRQRTLNDINRLSVRVLEAGYETPGRPAVLLLHGFPEVAYSWRKVMPSIADAGYHVIAPDHRGYGWTTGWDDRYDVDFASFRTHALARDALGVVSAMGYRSVAAVVGHDIGSIVASYCALVRPDVFRSLVMMSYPFDGRPRFHSTAPTSRQHQSRRPWTNSSLPCCVRAKTATLSSRAEAPTRTCCTRLRACTIFCAPTIT